MRVVAVAVEELDLPIVLPNGQLRLHLGDLAFEGQHLGDRPARQRVQLAPGRRQQQRAAPAKSSMALSGLDQSAWSDFGVLAVGPLSFWQVRDGCIGVVTAGALLFRVSCLVSPFSPKTILPSFIFIFTLPIVSSVFVIPAIS